MNADEWDVLDASLTLRNLSREQKQAVARLMELSIEETMKKYTAKLAALAFGIGIAFIVGFMVGAEFVLYKVFGR